MMRVNLTPPLRRLLAWCVFGAAMAFAAGAHAAGGGADHGSPWMDLLYKTVNFLILVGLLFYFLRKPVSGFFRNTAARLKATLDDARNGAVDAEKRLEQQQKDIDNLRNELDSMQEQARGEAETEKQRLKADAMALAERVKEQTKLQVEQARNQAFGSIRRELAGEAVRLAEKMIEERMDAEQQHRLVSEYIDRLEARS